LAADDDIANTGFKQIARHDAFMYGCIGRKGDLPSRAYHALLFFGDHRCLALCILFLEFFLTLAWIESH
jgi:hypothetical protein